MSIHRQCCGLDVGVGEIVYNNSQSRRRKAVCLNGAMWKKNKTTPSNGGEKETAQFQWQPHSTAFVASWTPDERRSKPSSSFATSLRLYSSDSIVAVVDSATGEKLFYSLPFVCCCAPLFSHHCCVVSFYTSIFFFLRPRDGFCCGKVKIKKGIVPNMFSCPSFKLAICTGENVF